MYFLDAKQSRVCSCGKSDKPQILDRNLFAETVYMEDLVSQLDDMIRKSPDAHSYRPEVKHKAIIGGFFSALKQVRENKRQGCIEEDRSSSYCTSATKTELQVADPADLPEVIPLNLTWADRNPPANAVLKTLASIPEMFNVSDLYDT